MNIIEEIPHLDGHKLSPKQDSKIVKAAIKYDNLVYTGWRHSNIIKHLISIDKLDHRNEDQGFVDQYGQFYNRYQSARIAFHAKQINKIPHVLTSEDLWDVDGNPRDPEEPYHPLS